MKNQKLIIILLVAILFVVLLPYLLLGTVITSNSILSQRGLRNSADQTARGIANYHMFGFET